MSEILKLENITKSYDQNDESLTIIKNSSFALKEREVVAFIGPSGCGKTTFLQICGLLDTATHGSIFINNKNVDTLSDFEKTIIRRKNIGFIFQFHHLLPEFSVLENVLMPALIENQDKKALKDKAKDILNSLGLASKIKSRPNELSGGEKQRVAIARSIINNPNIILADEPTGNLDPDNAKSVFDMLLKVVREQNSSLLMVSHNMALTKDVDRIITIKDKRIVELDKVLFC